MQVKYHIHFWPLVLALRQVREIFLVLSQIIFLAVNPSELEHTNYHLFITVPNGFFVVLCFMWAIIEVLYK